MFGVFLLASDHVVDIANVPAGVPGPLHEETLTLPSWVHGAAPSVYGTALLSMLSIASCVAAPPCCALGAGVQGGGTQPPSLSSGRGWLGLGTGLEFGLGLGLGLGSGSGCIHTSLCLGRGGGLPRWLLHASVAPLPLLPLGMPLLLPRLEVARRAGWAGGAGEELVGGRADARADAAEAAEGG